MCSLNIFFSIPPVLCQTSSPFIIHTFYRSSFASGVSEIYTTASVSFIAEELLLFTTLFAFYSLNFKIGDTYMEILHLSSLTERAIARHEVREIEQRHTVDGPRQDVTLDEDDDVVIIYNRVPKTASTSFTNIAYDLCAKNKYHVLHINTTKNNPVMSLQDQVGCCIWGVFIRQGESIESFFAIADLIWSDGLGLYVTFSV